MGGWRYAMRRLLATIIAGLRAIRLSSVPKDIRCLHYVRCKMRKILNVAAVVLVLAVPLGLLIVRGVGGQGTVDNPGEQIQYVDPYWGLSIWYPANWNLQSNPFQDFGFRIGSPDLTVDPLGRPYSGAFLAVLVREMTEEEWKTYKFKYRNEIKLAGVPGVKSDGIDTDGYPFAEWAVFTNQHLHMFRFVSASREIQDERLPIVQRMLNSLVFTGEYSEHPTLEHSKLLGSIGSFSPIKHAFEPGSGKITKGYGSGAPCPDDSHCGGDLYALDICPDSGCSRNGLVLAPTDIKLVWSGPGYGMPGSSKDFHIFEISEDDGGSKLCMSLAHFEITLPGFTVGKRVPRGAAIGRLVDYVYGPHIHMGIWHSPQGSGCAGGSREPLPYTDAYQLDGVDYLKGQNHRTEHVTSTNYGICVAPSGLYGSPTSLSGLSNCIPELPPPPSNDSATFVSDITLPDGSVVSPGQALVKTWRVRNSGTSTWDGYKLIFLQGDQMGGASPVNIPTTSPNQEVNISVSLQAPTTPGDKVGYWQIVNRDGVYVPGGKLWVSVNVVSSTTSDRIASFSADPPSPSSASTVRLYARVNWWPQFRAMRVKVDNQVIGETAAAEYTFNWDTSSASRGDHTLVLEVADQTDNSWSRPERRVMAYTLQGTPTPANHAPNRPSPSSPYDWYVYYSGNTAQLCAQANGDPDGDAITGYYFDIYGSAQLWNSGWAGSNCVTTGALGPYNYQWRVKVRDSRGAESDWSDTWHFTLVNPNLSISELYFQPQDGNSEQVKIRACTTGQGGVGITMRVSVNDANDGSGNGTWHIIKELGVPCFNDVDAPVWNTLEYGDGPHRVRAEAHGASTGWNGAAVREETYTLPHRRPASPRLLAPIPPSGNIREAVYLNSRTITFRWQPTIRANSYTLHIGTNPSPKDGSNPVFRQTFGSSFTEYTVTFGQDYPTLYWQVTAANDVGTNASGDQLFGIDRAVPSCTVQPLPAVTYESVFQVNWSGSDNLAGIRTFDVQYLDSGRDVWSDWFTGIPVAKTYDLFTGQPGHTYYFRCRATDNANNTGNYPANANTATKIDPAARPPTPWWNSAYSGKRNLTILNNMPGTTLPIGYPVRLHFDGSTTPTAVEIYNASQSSTKCYDLRIIYNDATELDRVMQNCSSSVIDLWFRTQVSIAGGASNNTSHQLYYGNANAGTPLANINNVFYPSADSNTIGLWYLEGNTGDSSTYGHNGQWLGDASWVNGKFGQGISLPGGNVLHGGIRVPGTETLRVWSFTIEAFIKRARADSNCGDFIASQGQSNEARERWHTGVEGDKLRLQIWNSGDKRSNPGAFPVDTNWHHVAATFDNNTHEFRFYRDGEQVYQGQMDSAGFVYGDPTFYIGSLFPYTGGELNSFCGTIDAVRLSNVVRTSFLPYGSFTAITNEPTAAVGSPIAPPITGSPDLVVLSLTAYPNSGGGVLVQAVVKNQGNLSTQNGFYTDLYANHLPTGAGDLTGSISFWVASPIEAGKTATLTTVITDLPAGGSMHVQSISAASETTSTLYAQVDSTGAVSEPDKLNNISGGTEVCIAPADSYESDDTAAIARLISVSITEAHNFHAAGDQDWFKFEAWAGNSYTIEIANLGLNSDTYLYLYDADGATLLAANDDYGGTLASKIIWQAPANGTYYVMVKHWNPNVGGCGTGYELSVTLFGDLDRDCDVDVVDVQTVASRWRCKCGDACYNSRYDLDGDCDIDIVDIMKVAAQWGNTCAPGASQFIGHWENEDPNTGGITRVEIRSDVSTIFVHMWGKCHPTDCDWGEETTAISDANDGVLSITWTFSFAVNTQQLTVLSDGRLRVTGHVHFTDNSGRLDYDYTHYFVRAGGGAAASLSPSPDRAKASIQNPTVRLTPANSTVAASSTFTVTVMIDEAVDLGAFQFDLRYSPASVQVETITLGGFLASTGRTAAPAGPKIDNGAGFASFAGFSFGTPPGPNGSGALALVRLRAVRAGTSPLDLNKVQVLDTQVKPQMPTVEDGSITVESGEHKLYLPIILKNYHGQL